MEIFFKNVKNQSWFEQASKTGHKCYLHQIKILIQSVSHDVLLITSVGGPLVAWVVLGIQVTEGRLINVDLIPIGLDRILFELETNLFTI